jgi:DNA sulfur modification protein DndD
MKITKLKLNNFRQFHGEITLPLECHPPRNVVVIHGVNGAGKTALLNAFTWALYGRTTPALKLPKRLVSRQAFTKSEDDLALPGDKSGEMWVEVHFEHRGTNHVFRRTLVENQSGTDENGQTVTQEKPKFTLQTERHGEWVVQEGAADVMAKILPDSLHNYFFFDGERMENIVNEDPTEQKNLGTAIRRLLGLEILQKSQNHLNGVRRELQKELSRVGDAKTKKLIEQLELAQDRIQKVKEELEQVRTNISNDKAVLKGIEAQLEDNRDAKVLMEKEARLKQQKETLEREKGDCEKELKEVISRKSYAVFLPQRLRKFEARIEDLRAKGELPAGIKRQFVDDLLEKNLCICDRELPAGSPDRKAVEKWREKGGLVDVEERAIQMAPEVRKLREQAVTVFSELDKTHQRKVEAIDQIARVESEIAKIITKLGASQNVNVRALEEQRGQIREALDNWNQKKGALDREMHDLNGKVKELNRKIEQGQMEENRQRVARERVRVASDMQERFALLLERQSKDYQDKLAKRISEIYRRMTRFPYEAYLSPEWGITLQNSDGVSVGASTGQSSTLTLSFLSGIIGMVRSNNEDELNLQAAEYPIVMDAPFSSLDPRNRKAITEAVPEAANQVIVMVKKGDWQGEVEEGLREKVARSFVLTYHTPKEGFKATDEEFIDLDGHVHPLLKRSEDDKEHTTVTEVEVSHG